MGLVLLVGTMLGAGVGSLIGDLLTGGDSAARVLLGHPRGMLAMLLTTIVPGIAATLWFYSRGRLAASEARAEQAQRLAAENQLRLLEAQLEPHMLFNTLANLRVLIGLDPPRAQAMLDQLIAFLRATLNASRVGRHALSAEFSRLADYLALMQVRMGDRLQARLDLPDALATLAVPPLLLQPLVENAIRHGLEPQVAGGRIEVRAARDGNDLVLTVRDTGVGLQRASPDGSHFGLQQVRDRLATLYGAAASLTLAGAADAEGGTCATVRLPIAT
jgi:LytS/YehU family sensor histidine kinase